MNYSVTTNKTFFSAEENPDLNKYIRLAYRPDTSSRLQFYWGSTSNVTAPSSLTPGLWYHLALTRTGSTVTAYINGAATVGSVGTDFTGSLAKLIIGNGGSLAATAESTISDLRIYSIALDTTQITDPYQRMDFICSPTTH